MRKIHACDGNGQSETLEFRPEIHLALVMLLDGCVAQVKTAGFIFVCLLAAIWATHTQSCTDSNLFVYVTTMNVGSPCQL
jgi:hypothetical protein